MGVRSARKTIDRSDLLESVTHRLSSLSQMEQDWDSYGGVPPTAVAVEEALGLCRRVADVLGPDIGEGALPATISPLANGGVQLEGQGDDHLIAIDVGPDGSRGYLKKTGSGRFARYQEDEGVTDEALLPLVRELLWVRHTGSCGFVR